jgi:hypothetical protein
MNHNTTQNGTIILLPILALISPFLLWPIEFFLPYPYFVEEIAKIILVCFILKGTLKIQDMFALVVTCSLLFTLSESIFYYINFIGFGLMPFFQRILLTGSLHALTSSIMLACGLVSSKLLPVGLILAITVHYLYNSLVGLLIHGY